MLLEFLLFWVSLGLLFFCYAGYGILLFLYNSFLSLFKRKKKLKTGVFPPVTLVIAAYNEEEILLQKIQNTLDIDYPSDLISIIIITDGSVDNSEAVVKQFPSINLLHQKERKGKLAALKRAVQFVKTDLVVFSDANTMLNRECISYIVDHYSNSKVGGVAGEKKIASSKHVSALGEAEGLYWRYESFLKKQDAQFYTVVGAAGELFSIRTKLFENIDDNIILDDFITSMKVCLAGYKIEYEPKAYAVEMPSASLREEAKRKIRISTGAYQSIGYLKSCLNFFRYPALSFQYISRRLLRWVICPPLLIVLFVCIRIILR